MSNKILGLRPIIVLGMHRSGTSAVSGALSNIGVFLGQNLFKPQAGVNEKGFFENSTLVKINERLLTSFYSSWDDPLAFLMDVRKKDFGSLHSEAVDFLKSEYLEHKHWGMKDPRTTLLLPFWQNVFNDLDVKPFYLIMIRDPAEVCLSLFKRDGFSAEKSLLLWLNYTFCCFEKYDAESHLVMNYDFLLDEPESSLQKVINAYAPELSTDLEKGSGFVTKSLKNNSENEAFDKVSEPLKSIAEELFVLTASESIDIDKLSALRDRYRTYLQSLCGPISEHLKSVKMKELEYRKLFDDAYFSSWWKFSWPLRAVERFFSKK